MGAISADERAILLTDEWGRLVSRATEACVLLILVRVHTLLQIRMLANSSIKAASCGLGVEACLWSGLHLSMNAVAYNRVRILA